MGEFLSVHHVLQNIVKISGTEDFVVATRVLR